MPAAQVWNVRPKSYTNIGVRNHIMKKSITLIFVTSSLLLASCSTERHVTR